MNMIEKVARAIDPDVWSIFDGEDQWRKIQYHCRREASLQKARDAIEAMREPTVNMVAAFWRQKNCGSQEVGETGEDRSDYAAWRAAIGAALSEAPEGKG